MVHHLPIKMLSLHYPQPNSNQQRRILYLVRAISLRLVLLQPKLRLCSVVINQLKCHLLVKLTLLSSNPNQIQAVVLVDKVSLVPQTLNQWALQIQELLIQNQWDSRLKHLQEIKLLKLMLCQVSHLETHKAPFQLDSQTKMLNHSQIYSVAILKTMQLLMDSRNPFLVVVEAVLVNL